MHPNIEEILTTAGKAQHTMPEGHRERFLQKLSTTKPKKRKVFFLNRWSIAASLALVIGVSAFLWNMSNNPEYSDQTNLDLQVISPELHLVESRYMQAINHEIANLEVSSENEAIVEHYFDKLALLDEKYERLNKELFSQEMNETTIDEIILNLQLRLDLLLELKDRLSDGNTYKKDNYAKSTI